MPPDPKTFLVASEETIRKQKDEILQLRLKNRQLQQRLKESGDGGQQPDLDETNRGVVASLMATIAALELELKEAKSQENKPQETNEQTKSPERELINAECQTMLDSYNMEALFEANLKLKLHNQAHKRPPPPNVPIVNMATSTATRLMHRDERATLEKLMTINGSLTTARDKLKAKSGC